jgi:hypothetical protein
MLPVLLLVLPTGDPCAGVGLWPSPLPLLGVLLPLVVTALSRLSLWCAFPPMRFMANARRAAEWPAFSSWFEKPSREFLAAVRSVFSGMASPPGSAAVDADLVAVADAVGVLAVGGVPKPTMDPHICLPRAQRLRAIQGSSRRPISSSESAALPAKSSRKSNACCHQRVPGLRCMPLSAAAAAAAGDRPAAAARASEPDTEAADRDPDDCIWP